MKNVVLAIAAVLVLIALPAAAQYDATTPTQTTTETSATTSTETTPSTSLTNTQQPAEERTNPTSPMHSNDPGLTARGTVVSWNDDEVVLRTTTGLTHFKLMPNTVGSRTFTEGQALAIDFQRNEQGVLLAKQIRSADLAPVTETTTGAATAGQAIENTADEVGEDLSRVDDAVEEEVEEAVGTSIDNDGAIGNDENPTNDTSTTASTTTTTDTSLPATGSNAPLAGLLGLLALGGAAALRRL